MLAKIPSKLIGAVKNDFPGKRIVIVGDLVADQFLRGTISRVSREAPVFILRHDETETLPGGAANAGVNVASLGGVPVLIGIVGDDENGSKLRLELDNARVECAHILTADKFRTTTKVRVLAGQQYAGRQQVIRIDYENQNDIAAEVRGRLQSALRNASTDADAIIISDYNYGVTDQALVQLARQISNDRRIPLLIDSRFRLPEFHGATTATPNQDEVEQILGKGFTDRDCEKLRQDLGHMSLLVTRGNQGMLVLEQGREPVNMEAVGPKEPVDVTGAGDTVIAVYALGLASGLSFSEAAIIANHAGGIVVMKKGTAHVTTGELVDSISSFESVRGSAESGKIG